MSADALDSHGSNKVSWEMYKVHIVMLLKLSWPNILTSLISLAIPVTSTMAVGHLGAVYIGAAALGNMYANATGVAVGIGFSMALDTLCSQAYGAKKYKLVGLHCQRAMVILTIGCVPIGLLWYNSHFILQFIGSPETVSLSQFWIRRLIISLWPRVMYETYRRYLMSQRVMWPLTASVGCVVPIHILNTYLFVYKFGGGFDGAALATSLSYWILFLFLIAVTQIRLHVLRKRLQTTKHRKLQEVDDFTEEEDSLDIIDAEELEANGDPLHTWPAWSKDVFRGWAAFLRLGIATALSLMIEWGSFEVNAAIAARIGDGEIALAAHAIMSSTVSLWYAFPVGVASASSALVGNMLGAGEPEKAKIVARVAFIIALSYGLLNGALGQLYKDFLGFAFTNEQPVVDLISQLMLIMWLYGLVDAIKAIGMAILRGSGRPTITVPGNVLSCLIIGYPVALAMVFKGHYGLQGLWFGMSMAWLTASAIYGTIVARTDWPTEVLNAAKRNAEAERSTLRGSTLALGPKSHNMSVVIKDLSSPKLGINTSEGDEFSIGDEGPSEEQAVFLAAHTSEE